MGKQYLNHNTEINSIYGSCDPDYIAELLISELSIIIESISPSKHVQCSSNYVPWITAEQRSEAHLRDNYHKTATKTNSEDDSKEIKSIILIKIINLTTIKTNLI